MCMTHAHHKKPGLKFDSITISALCGLAGIWGWQFLLDRVGFGMILFGTYVLILTAISLFGLFAFVYQCITR